MAMKHYISRQEYIAEIKPIYAAARRSGDKKAKSRILDDACCMTGLSRKHLIARFGEYRQVRTTGFALSDRTVQQDRRGRPVLYRSTAFLDALLICWRATNCSCAENLQLYLPELIPQLEVCGELTVDDETRCLLLSASVSTKNNTAIRKMVGYARFIIDRACLMMSSSNHRGFTIAGLLIVIVDIAILCVIATTSYSYLLAQ